MAGGEGCISSTAVKSPMDEKKDYVGLPPCCTEQGRVTAHGALWAMDLKTGKIIGKATFQPPTESGMLSTDGDVLFTGHMNGKLAAYDADTLAGVVELQRRHADHRAADDLQRSTASNTSRWSPAARSACGRAASSSRPPSSRCSASEADVSETTKGERLLPLFSVLTHPGERAMRQFPACDRRRRWRPRWQLAPRRRQAQAPKIWDIKLGSPIKDLPLPISSTPPAAPMAGRRRACSRASTNSRSARSSARPGCTRSGSATTTRWNTSRAPAAPTSWCGNIQANSLAGQPIITSLLIDDGGLVQGYRVVNDPRVDAQTRIAAFGLADLFKGMAWTGLECNDLPPAEGERPIDDLFVKEDCENKTDGLVTRVEARRYYKPGQFAVDPNDNRLTENLFESSARLEVYRPGAAAQARRQPPRNERSLHAEDVEAAQPKRLAWVVRRRLGRNARVLHAGATPSRRRTRRR